MVVFRKEIKMDPYTATMNAIAAFFQWASTPPGQQVLNDVIALDKKILSDISGLVAYMNGQKK